MSLCDQNHLIALKQKIGEIFRDGEGKVVCCYSNGCNKDIDVATASLQYLQSSIAEEEMEILRQQASDIKRYFIYKST